MDVGACATSRLAAPVRLGPVTTVVVYSGPTDVGESDAVTLKIRWCLAIGLYSDPGATLDDLREAVSTLEEIEPSARRVLGGSHPLLSGIALSLRESRAVLRAHKTPSASA